MISDRANVFEIVILPSHPPWLNILNIYNYIADVFILRKNEYFYYMKKEPLIFPEYLTSSQ